MMGQAGGVQFNSGASMYPPNNNPNTNNAFASGQTIMGMSVGGASGLSTQSLSPVVSHHNNNNPNNTANNPLLYNQHSSYPPQGMAFQQQPSATMMAQQGGGMALNPNMNMNMNNFNNQSSILHGMTTNAPNSPSLPHFIPNQQLTPQQQLLLQQQQSMVPGTTWNNQNIANYNHQ